MGKYSGIFLCSDFDGTLAYKAHVPQNNIDAIKYFCQNGGIFSVASGRTLDFLNGYVDELCLDSYVACVNGTQIFHRPTGRLVHEVFLPDDSYERTVKFLGDAMNFSDITVFTNTQHIQISLSEPSFHQILDEQFEKKSVYKLLLHRKNDITDADVDFIKSVFGDRYEVARSWIHGLEISSIDATKGIAARKMAELAGADTLICVGDYENDIPLLCAADISYAVANAIPSLKAIASRTTVDVTDGAIAAIINEL